MIDIIHFSMTSSPVVNYVFDVVMTSFLVFIPIKLINSILDRAIKWF